MTHAVIVQLQGLALWSPLIGCLTVLRPPDSSQVVLKEVRKRSDCERPSLCVWMESVPQLLPVRLLSDRSTPGGREWGLRSLQTSGRFFTLSCLRKPFPHILYIRSTVLCTEGGLEVLR